MPPAASLKVGKSKAKERKEQEECAAIISSLSLKSASPAKVRLRQERNRDRYLSETTWIHLLNTCMYDSQPSEGSSSLLFDSTPAGQPTLPYGGGYQGSNGLNDIYMALFSAAPMQSSTEDAHLQGLLHTSSANRLGYSYYFVVHVM